MLAKSQLRAGRGGKGGGSIFRNVAILGAIDAVCFAASVVVGFFVVSFVKGLPAPQSDAATGLILGGLEFVPLIVPSAVLVAGVLFELGASSKFASSDSVNWLPVAQVEYVTASILSVAYDYSLVPSIIMGATLFPAFELGYGATWVEMVFLSVASLFYAGALVEIIRAAINRVSTVMMGRARRGALVLRLLATVGVILLVEVIFNFVILIDLIGSFSSALSSVAFIPVLWGSLAVRASEAGSTLENALFALATLGFTGATLWVAVKVRSRYWSPTPSTVRVTSQEYSPAAKTGLGLSLFGLRGVEATLVRKDLRGLTRRRELLQYFAIPFVLAIVFLFEMFAAPGPSGSGGGSGTAQLSVWFVGGFSGLLFSSISFGQEGRSASLLYSLPLTAGQVLRAKMFISTVLSVVSTVSIFVLVLYLSKPAPLVALEEFAVAIGITLEEVCIGTAFGARYPDFQERPRPRFVDPWGLIGMMVVGLGVMFATAVPVLVSAIVPSAAGGERVSQLFLASMAFAVAVIALSYTWARRETRKLLVEFRS